MKVVYEQGEIERIEECQKKIVEKGVYLGLFNGGTEKVYGLTFKVTNPALAEYILISLLNDRLEDFELGINVQSIEFDVLLEEN